MKKRLIILLAMAARQSVIAGDGRVLSAWNHTLLITDNTRTLLSAQRPASP